ncbi:MAG: pentapeptide repeat-containing protein, partial [Nostoc sp.]
MRLPTAYDPDPLRKPDNKQEVFADGDFANFIKPIFDTLDLYHNQGVDPRAVAIAFKNLAENHPEAELEIVGMEKRGDDKILLRAKTAVGSDKSQLSAEYFDDYNQLKALSQSQQL